MIARRGSVADAEALVELRELPPSELAPFVAWMAAHSSTHLPFVASLDGRVIGAAWLLIAERVAGPGGYDRRFGDVQSVMVHPSFRQRGAGAALMAAILAEARERGLSHVTVHSGRRAVDFYLRNGFTHDRQMLIWSP